MEFRHVGRSGLVVSAVGLGCGNLGRDPSEPGRRVIPDERSKEVLRAALDAGITLFDTSDSYGRSEELLGAYLGGVRDDIVLATKFGTTLKGALGEDFGARGARHYVRRAVERSLRRLRTDRIDLYQIHRLDPGTPIEETLSVLTDLVREGKVRYLGSSNFAAWQVVEAEHEARSLGLDRFISAQNRYHLLDRRIEADLVPACLKYGIGLITWKPLADGHLTGKYRRDLPASAQVGAARRPSDASFDVIERLEAVAARWEATLLDLAVGGLAAQPGVSSVIAGATSADHVRANVKAGEWRPSASQLAELDTASASPTGRS